MTLLQAICHVLQDAGTPLHYQEITERILTQGLWAAAGQTPAASVSAVLTTELKRQGEDAPFARVGPGLYAWCATTGNTPVVMPAPDAPTEAVSFNDAAALILEQAGQPLHYKALTEMAIAQGLIQTKGQTPAATMNAQLTREIATATSRGELPRFIQHGQGMYGLSTWQPKGITWEIEAHNASIRQQLLTHLQTMKPATAFEDLVGELLQCLGFEDVVVTAKSGDGGVDVRGVLVACGGLLRLRYAIQVKRWKANIHAPDIQHLRGSLMAEEHGLFVTTSDYSAGAYAEAQAPGKAPIHLMTGRQFLGLLIEHGVLVESVTMRVLELTPVAVGQTGA